MKIRFLRFCTFTVVCALAACATTTLTQTWKDPNLRPGTIKNMLVVGIAKEASTRMLFEDAFAAQLRAHGISVVKSYEVITLEELNNKQGAIEKIRSLGVDTVLATRLVDKETIETYYPPTYNYYPSGAYRDWGAYYGSGYAYMTTPGYTASEQVTKLETNIYDVQTEKLVWSALSDTWVDRADKGRILSDFIEVMIERMTKDGLIPAAVK